MEQRTPEWEAARKGRLTASMVGAALGLAPYQSFDDCFRALVRSINDLPSEFEGNIATSYGTANEATAVAAYMMETGNKVEPAPFVPLEDWSGASPDGYIGEDGLLEVKCPFGKRDDTSPVFDDISNLPHYYAQIQVQLFVTKRKWCDFWQWSKHGSRLQRVDYDADWLRENMPALFEFWARAKNADPADYDGPKRHVIDTPEASRLVTEYDELSEAIENAKARQDDIKARLVQIANGRDALVAGKSLTLVKRKGSVSYAKALAKYAPDADLEPFRGKDSEFWQLK